MRKKIYKWLSLVIILIMCFTSGMCAITTSAETKSGVVMEQGTIDANAGQIMPNVLTRIYTRDLIAIEDCQSVSLATGYKAYYHFYSESGVWRTSSQGWKYGSLTKQNLQEMANGATHFRVVIGTSSDASLSPSGFPSGALTITTDNSSETAVTVKPTMAQGTIDGNAGEVKPGVSTRLYTKYYLLVADYAKVTIASGYKASLHFYNKNGDWIGYTGKWLYGEITSTQITAFSPSAVYFAVIISNENDNDIFLKNYNGEALTLTLASGLSEPTVSEIPILSDTTETPELPEDPNISLPKMINGTIDGETGAVVSASDTRIYTEELLSVEKYEMVRIAKGYKGWFHCYDKDGKWLTSFGWQEAKTADIDVPVSSLKAHSMDTAYFKVVIGELYNSKITPESFPTLGLKLIVDVEKYSDFIFENVFKIGSANYGGPWQEGAIFDGKLFMLNHEELGGVFDMESGEMIGDFICDRSDFLSVHSNSICFGTEYYDKNDKYPLMYICVYNNYEGQANQYEGHCGVYRITEDGSDFKGDLVQVIKIGFTEDLNMWKSRPNRGDICPYGNFIVDTDKNDFYAYVMRDATQTTRYYKFDLPKVSDGEYNSLFGCKTVTLNIADIKDQFDTEYSVYLQGADYVDGMILSSSGLGYGRDGGAILRLVDLESKKVIKVFDAMSAGVYNEPEVIAVDPDTKKVYYGSTDGQLRLLTCIDQYIGRNEPEEHLYSTDYSYDGENHWFQCQKCDDKKGLASHEYSNSCDTDCNVCNSPRTVEHDYEWVIDKKANCGESGIKHQQCIICNAKQNEGTLINATGDHDYDNANCKVPKTCKVCGDTIGDKLDHEYANACDTDCNLCGKVREVGEHKYTNEVDRDCNICDAPREINGQHLIEENGKVYYYLDGDKSTETGLFKIAGKWLYIENGVFMSDATTLIKYKGKWFYVKSGEWTKTSELVKYKGVWFLVRNGKWDSSVKTLTCKNGKWFYIKNGKWSKEKAVCVYKEKKIYVNKGFAQLQYSGRVIIGNKKYNVKFGKIV